MRYHKFLFIFSFFSISNFLFAQSHDTTIQKDSIHIQNLINKASKFRTRNIDSAELEVREALHLSTKSESNYLLARSHRLLGQILSEKLGEDNMYCSIEHVEKSIEYSRILRDSVLVFKSTNNLANTYLRMEDHPNGLKTALKAVDMAKSLNKNNDFNEELGVSYLSLGSIYLVMESYDKALESYKLGKSKLDKESRFYYAALANSGYINYKLKKYKEALALFDETYVGYQKHNDILGITRILTLQGMILYKMDSLSQAKNKYQKVIAISENNGHNISIAEGLYRIAQVEDRLKNHDSAMYYIDKAIALSDSLSFLDKKVTSLYLKGKLLEQKGDSMAAVKYFYASEQIKDSLLGRQNPAKSHSVLLEYKDEQHKKELSGFKSILAQKNYIIFLIIFLLILTGSISYFVINKYRFRLLKSNDLRLELEAALDEEKETKDYMNRKLTSSSAFIASNTDVLKETNNLLEKIKTSIRAEDLSNDVNQIQRQIEEKLTLDEAWDSFFHHFNEVHPQFLKSLPSKSDLSKTELKLCSFLKMNLTIKEISELMNISSSSLRVTTHRIKKKMNLSKDISLHQFLHSQEFIGN